ncbi:MAG: uroporphyrinogen decarboxylase [Candidatus Omnitrophica bacterium]|nr:uroporphyrinogen decarboxylase [Candidatus Omnitrophota bacterium]
MTEDSVFLKACRREETPYTPVWLMRQAGRYMKDYRLLRERTPFLDICKNKDLVTEITIGAQEKIGADAAIIFSDILLIVEPFGFDLSYLKGDGPSIRRAPSTGSARGSGQRRGARALRTAEDVERLPDIDPEESLGFLMEAIRQTRRALKPEVPLIGFAGAPFTLASYLIEGGASKDFAATKEWMRRRPGAWGVLMEKIARATAKYLNAQVRAGAQALQIFDSWVGCLSAEEYKNFALPHSAALIRSLDQGVPVIHFGTGTDPFLELFSRAGGDVIGVDHRVRLDEARERIGTKQAIQGNLDPQLLSTGSLAEIKRGVQSILKQAAGRSGHIFNLGHGVLPETPPKNVVALIQMVHELSQR